MQLLIYDLAEVENSQGIIKTATGRKSVQQIENVGHKSTAFKMKMNEKMKMVKRVQVSSKVMRAHEHVLIRQVQERRGDKRESMRHLLCFCQGNAHA